MEETIELYTDFLKNIRHVSDNTVSSYKLDLQKMCNYFMKQGIYSPDRITSTDINGYILWLEKQGIAPATISRYVASIKSYFHYMLNIGRVTNDPAMLIKPPFVEKKVPKPVQTELMDKLLSQPNPFTDKGIRDKAMLELMYATGIKVSEIIELKIDNLNIDLGYIVCSESKKERMLSIDDRIKEFLSKYINDARIKMLKGKESPYLFVNCRGNNMSRQGFWKIIKYYCKEAGIDENISPYSLRSSFEECLSKRGEDVNSIKNKMGYISSASVKKFR